jgi:hypothetical protein
MALSSDENALLFTYVNVRTVITRSIGDDPPRVGHAVSRLLYLPNSAVARPS